jgi:hypothetical protein
MAVLTSKGGVCGTPVPLRREKIELRNYIGREGLLKSGVRLLVLVIQ